MVSFDRSGDLPPEGARQTYTITKELLAKVCPDAIGNEQFRDALRGVSDWLVGHIRAKHGGPTPAAWDESLLAGTLTQELAVMGSGFGIICRRRVFPLVEAMRAEQGFDSASMIRVGALLLDWILEETGATREYALEVRASAQVEITRRMLMLPPRNQRDAAMLAMVVLLDVTIAKALVHFGVGAVEERDDDDERDEGVCG